MTWVSPPGPERIPTKELPRCKRKLLSEPFQIGRRGLLIMFVAVNLLGIASIIGTGLLYSFTPVNILVLIASILIGIAITLCAIAFRLIRQFYQFELNPAENSILRITWIFSIAFAWLLPLSELFIGTGLVWEQRGYYHYGHHIYYVRGPFFPHYVILQTFGYLFVGVIFLLWTGVFISLRKQFHGKPLDIAAISCFLISALLILILIPIYWVNGPTPWIHDASYFGQPFLGFLLLAVFVGPACILTAILFRRWDEASVSKGLADKRHLSSLQYELEITEQIRLLHFDESKRNCNETVLIG